MTQGVLYSLFAGILIALQSIFNTNISAKTGSWTMTTVVHGVGFLTGLLIVMFVRDGSVEELLSVNKMYYLSGIFGVLIVYVAAQGMMSLGPIYSFMILMVAQLLIALIINTNGWFNVEMIELTSGKVFGMIIMIIGIVIFQRG